MLASAQCDSNKKDKRPRFREYIFAFFVLTGHHFVQACYLLIKNYRVYLIKSLQPKTKGGCPLFYFIWFRPTI